MISGRAFTGLLRASSKRGHWKPGRVSSRFFFGQKQVFPCPVLYPASTYSIRKSDIWGWNKRQTKAIGSVERSFAAGDRPILRCRDTSASVPSWGLAHGVPFTY